MCGIKELVVWKTLASYYFSFRPQNSCCEIPYLPQCHFEIQSDNVRSRQLSPLLKVDLPQRCRNPSSYVVALDLGIHSVQGLQILIAPYI